MSRRFFNILVIALILLASVASSAFAGGQLPTKMVTLTGKLEFVTDLSAPHYEVGGYVLLYRHPEELTDMVGNQVVVMGTEASGPSIYMRKTLSVQAITPDSAPAPLPADNDQAVAIPAILPTTDPPVTLPVIGPGDDKPGSPVTVLPQPAPFFGTAFYVLFGRLETVQGGYYVVDQTGTIGNRFWINNSLVDLTDLVGQSIGAVAAEEKLPDGKVGYNVFGIVVLSRDLADVLKSGSGLIFQIPNDKIIVRLRGRVLPLNPDPIIGNSRSLVGLRAIAEAMGAEVEWNDATKTATVTLNGRSVAVTLASSRVILHQIGHPDVVLTTDIASVIVGGRMMVPLRVLSEGLGLKVDWNPATHTVDIH